MYRFRVSVDYAFWVPLVYGVCNRNARDAPGVAFYLNGYYGVGFGGYLKRGLEIKNGYIVIRQTLKTLD
jgi:hypothetical protein